MKYAQLVLLEPPGGCNMTDRHPECPAGVLGRARPAEDPMPACEAVRIAVELAGLGFRGQYAFHWFSEPLMSRPWVEAVMAGIRYALPNARFLLWTNGTLLHEPESWGFVSGFDNVFLSNYEGQLWKDLKRLCGNRLYVWQRPVMEPLMVAPPDSAAPQRAPLCRRPYTEFIVARTGDVHLCCQAWRPEQRIANIFQDGVAASVDRYRSYREDAAAGRRVQPGHPCIGCARPESVLARVADCRVLDPVIEAEALEDAAHA